MRSRRRLATTRSLFAVLAATSTVNAFVPPTTRRTTLAPSIFGTQRRVSTRCYWKLPSLKQRDDNDNKVVVDSKNNNAEQVMDELLVDGTKFRQAITHLKQNPSMELSRERWSKVFDAIEAETARAEENTLHHRNVADYPPTSPSRMSMTDMYATLKDLQHLQLFGAIPLGGAPASGSHIVTPTLLEQVTKLSMKSLTPKPTNTLLFAGIGFALLEGLVSVALDIDVNLLVLTTLFVFFVDRLFINGAMFESILKVFTPGISNKILRHEAGHFLCAYLLGCPVEGCVLDAWEALQDVRFGGRRTGVSAGTSFFDPILSQQINSSVVTRSSIDRYSVIVMGGIAAEAIHFGRADGGAGDEAALVAFLSQLNSGRGSSSSSLPPWNEQSIRNQARWGALQAVLLLRHYKVCYDALVKALEKGGNLGDCVYAIEEAGRKHNLKPLQQPMGYILDEGEYGKWSTTAKTQAFDEMDQKQDQIATASKEENDLPPQDVLKEYREIMQNKLRDIDERLKDIES